ncbi:MAG TPA: riboflavin synthase [Casimicrobiaceae bacterium]|nr:riboflavin synthase [Casimicrobiaceae bacterium]
MFTGIVQAVGRIATAKAAADGLKLTLDAGTLDLSDLGVGDSVAVSGCCLTIVAIDKATLCFDVSAETLRCTARLDRSGPVNLEKALRLSDRLGGHLVAGHVDGVGVVTRFERAAGDGENVELELEAPAELARFIASKGSIAVDGVSLTINAVAGRRFSVNLIPHTLAVTTLGSLAPGDGVNLEVDMVARYVARLQDVG